MSTSIIILLVYFMPTVIALLSKKKNTLAILTLNLLLGWTVLGWIIALVWAVTKDSNTTIVINKNADA
jgi:ABC-type transport system involved in cytochrome c biogenesis permease component